MKRLILILLLVTPGHAKGVIKDTLKAGVANIDVIVSDNPKEALFYSVIQRMQNKAKKPYKYPYAEVEYFIPRGSYGPVECEVAPSIVDQLEDRYLPSIYDVEDYWKCAAHREGVKEEDLEGYDEFLIRRANRSKRLLLEIEAEKLRKELEKLAYAKSLVETSNFEKWRCSQQCESYLLKFPRMTRPAQPCYGYSMQVNKDICATDQVRYYKGINYTQEERNKTSEIVRKKTLERNPKATEIEIKKEIFQVLWYYADYKEVNYDPINKKPLKE